jgi:MFS transporter, PPP family, 3-phenylpropionic acid transporter
MPNRDWFAPRLAAFYATLGIATGIGMPFFPLWLEYKGLDPGAIGIVLAAPMVVRIFCVPIATRLADRFNILRLAILISAVGSAVGHALIGLATGFIGILVCLVLASLFFTPGFPLTDAYALRGLAERRRAYGPVRLWSSAAYIAANVGGGFLIGVIARANIIWVLVAAFALGSMCAAMLLPLAPHPVAKSEQAPSAKVLWRSPVFVAVLIACSLVQASHALYYGFSTIDWTAKGMADTTIGALWALGVIAEILLFAASGFLGELIGPLAFVVIGAGGATLRWGIMATDPPLILLPVLQCLHALSFTSTHLGAMQFLARVAPPGLGATAQGDFAAAQAIVFSLAMGFSGGLFRAYGDLAYAAMALMAAVGFAVAIIAYAIRGGRATL